MGTFSLSQAIQSQVGSTSMAAMELAQPAAAQERTIETITAEILHYQAVGGDAVIQIGQRLIEAKAAIPHGGWLPWLSEQVHYSERTAQRLMKIARDCSNPTLVSDLGMRKALAIFALPQAEQEDFLREHDAVDMTAEQLEQAIRERDEAIATAKAEHAKAAKANDELLSERLEMNRFRDSNGKLHEENKRLSEKIKELEARPIDVAVQVDEKAVEKAKAEARAAAEAEWREKVKAAEEKLAKAKERAKAAEEKAGKAVSTELDEARKAQATAEAEAETLRATLEKLKAEQAAATVSGDADLATFQLLFGQADADINKMHGILLKVRGRGDSELGSKLASALLAIADKAKGAAT